jgi:YidC/Oxa1 family membrane protein insertase
MHRDRRGLGLGLSIVGLTVVVRIVLIPLFVKQIHASRRMQLIQPEMQKIQAKYKGKTDPESRQAMTQETMDLYKKTGTNPFSSCLPILLAVAVLLRAVHRAQQPQGDRRGLPRADRADHRRAWPSRSRARTSLGRRSPRPSSDRPTGDQDRHGGADRAHVGVDVHDPASADAQEPADSALDNPFMKQQTVMLYLMPIFFAISGINFPIGVLLYWLTTNVWSMGQQFYVIRRMPAPGLGCRASAARAAGPQGKDGDPVLGQGAGSAGGDRRRIEHGRRARARRAEPTGQQAAPTAHGQEAREAFRTKRGGRGRIRGIQRRRRRERETQRPVKYAVPARHTRGCGG